MAQNQEVEKKLAVLRERFNSRIKETIIEIEKWNSSRHVEELIQLSHKFAGSAGTFGLPQLSADMKELERQLLNIKDQEITKNQADNLYQKAIRLLEKAL